MYIDSKIRHQLLWQNLIFTVLLLCLVGLLAFFSVEYQWQSDWTYGQRNTLSEVSQKLLAKMPEPIKFTVFATQEEDLRKPVSDLIGRFQQHHPAISLHFVDPDLEPELIRQNKIVSNGELIIDYGGKTEHVRDHSEASYSNALQRLARNQERWILVLTGHGEREPEREANHDLSEWVQHLTGRGLKVQSYNLSKQPAIPDNTAVLVVASPQVDYLPGEVSLVEHYLDQGGNLLWLADPGPLQGLDSIAKRLQLQWLPGMVVDPTSQLFGIDDPRFTVVPDYPSHPITDNFAILSLFPQARGIKVNLNEQWQTSEFLRSTERSWSETGELTGKVRFDQDHDVRGPITVGLAMSREVHLPQADSDLAKSNSPPAQTTKTRDQRIVVVGDGDFLSNTYLGNGGNLDLGLNIINWLSHDDQLMDIPTKTAPDTQLVMDSKHVGALGLFFFLLLPASLASGGAWIWYRRRSY